MHVAPTITPFVNSSFENATSLCLKQLMQAMLLRKHVNEKSVNFAIIHIPEANAQLMEKSVMFAIKGTISKFAAHVSVKKYMKLKRTSLMNPQTRAIMNFLLKLLIFRILHLLTKSRMKTLIGQ